MNKSNERGGIDQVTKAATTTPDLDIPFESCLTEERPDPCMIVIVGASGDLTSRKVVPALFNLYVNNGLPHSFLILGCARTKLSTPEFEQLAQRIIPELENGDQPTLAHDASTNHLISRYRKWKKWS